MDRDSQTKNSAGNDPNIDSSLPPSSLTALEEEARSHCEAGNFNRAIYLLEKITDLAPDNIPARFNLGVLYHSKGDLDKAINSYNYVRAVIPEHFQVHINLAKAFKEQDKLEEAITSLEDALRIDATHVDTLFDLGALYLMRNQFHDTIRCLEQGLTLSPGCSSAYYNLGLAYFHLGNHTDAASLYLKAAKCDPEDGDICFNLGLTYQALENQDRAIFWYKKAAQINSNDPDIYFNLGTIHKGLQKIEAAVAYFEKCVSLTPASGAALANLGMLYSILDRRDEAITCYKRALQAGYEAETAKHMVAALTGENLESAAPQYVVDLFDNYAEHFDQALLDDLEYQVPDLLRQLMESVELNKNNSYQNVLDLGAGTGLAGIAFRSISRRLTGIDLSIKMIAKARERNIYSRLHVSEIITFLEKTDEKYDLLIAADVFTYIGNLTNFFDKARRCLLPEGRLVFSTEHFAGTGFSLKSSGRYGHAPAYIQNLIREYGWRILKQQDAALRKDKGEWIQGRLYLLQFQ